MPTILLVNLMESRVRQRNHSLGVKLEGTKHSVISTIFDQKCKNMWWTISELWIKKVSVYWILAAPVLLNTPLLQILSFKKFLMLFIIKNLMFSFWLLNTALSLRLWFPLMLLSWGKCFLQSWHTSTLKQRPMGRHIIRAETELQLELDSVHY